MKKLYPPLILLTVAALVALGVCVAIQRWNDQMWEKRVELRQSFAGVIELTDEVAVAKAREVMAKRGYDVTVWQPMGESEHQLPYGVHGPFLRRNVQNANAGVIQFVDLSMKDSNITRLVKLELHDQTLECELIRPK